MWVGFWLIEQRDKFVATWPTDPWITRAPCWARAQDTFRLIFDISQASLLTGDRASLRGLTSNENSTTHGEFKNAPKANFFAIKIRFQIDPSSKFSLVKSIGSNELLFNDMKKKTELKILYFVRNNVRIEINFVLILFVCFILFYIILFVICFEIILMRSRYL